MGHVNINAYDKSWRMHGRLLAPFFNAKRRKQENERRRAEDLERSKKYRYMASR